MSKYRRLISSRDKNEPEIIQAWEDGGAWVVKQGTGAGFDLLVILGDFRIIIEVKDPAASHIKYTEAEKRMEAECKRRGVLYHVQFYPSQILDIVKQERMARK